MLPMRAGEGRIPDATLAHEGVREGQLVGGVLCY